MCTVTACVRCRPARSSSSAQWASLHLFCACWGMDGRANLPTMMPYLTKLLAKVAVLQLNGWPMAQARNKTIHGHGVLLPRAPRVLRCRLVLSGMTSPWKQFIWACACELAAVVCLRVVVPGAGEMTAAMGESNTSACI